ncbi:MAG: hypothetical protein GC205_05855 [Bacteroidetes bacterium]|nr:hypothetical protein [Bacteroidota bacterium]
MAEPASPTRSEPALEPAVRSGEEKTFNEWLALYLVKPSPSQREASRDAAEAALRDTPPFTLPQVEVEAARTPVPAGGEPSTHIAPEAPPLPAVFEPAASEIDLGGDSQQLETLIERQRALRARRFGTVAGTNAVSGNADKGYGFSGSSEPAVTETYAGILLAQGKWAEAEAIYQALSLRYPEKSGFFANLIREIQDKKSA